MNLISESNAGLIKVLALFHGGRSIESKRGQAQSLAAMMAKSTQGKTHKQLQAAIDYYGGQIEVYASSQYLTVEMICLSRYALPMVELLYEIIYQSKFNLKEWNIQRPIIQDTIRQQGFQTDYWANKMMNDAIFGQDHLTEYYSRPEDYDGISIQDIRQYYQEHLLTSRPQWFLAGSDISQVQKIISESASIPISPIRRHHVAIPIVNHPNYLKKKVPLASQSSIRLAIVLPRKRLEDYISIELISFYLGGHYLSELMSELRIRRGYTYGAYSHCTHYLDFTILTISFETDEQYIESSFRAIKGLFARLKSNKHMDFSAVVEQYIAAYSKQSEQALNEILYAVRFHKLKLSYSKYKRIMDKKTLLNYTNLENYLSLILDYHVYTKTVAY